MQMALDAQITTTLKTQSRVFNNAIEGYSFRVVLQSERNTLKS